MAIQQSRGRNITCATVLLLLALPASAQVQPNTLATPIQYVPSFGTFYSLTLLQAPFPFNPFPELSLYLAGDRIYVYDDRSVDYEALRALKLAEAAAPAWMSKSSGVILAGGNGGGVMLMSGPMPPPPGGGGGGSGGGGGATNPPAYSLPGLKVIIHGVTNGTAYLRIAEGQAGISYDFFGTTNLIGGSILESSWAWLGQGLTGLTYYFTNQPSAGRFYVLGTPQNMDGDAWTDAYEQLVSHTDPYGGLPPFNVFITQPSAFSTLP